jgi:hypothetical protein
VTRTIDSQQSPLRYRSELVRLDLVKLITYSDRAASPPTVDTTFYFARQPVLFDWNNSTLHGSRFSSTGTTKAPIASFGLSSRRSDG